MDIRTDLALETRESDAGTNVEIPGVVLEKEDSNNNLTITKVIIKDEAGAKAMGKPIGNYITIEAPMLIEDAFFDEKYLVNELSKQIKRLTKTNKKILVVGLGNRDATPDSLGPRTVEKLNIYGNEEWEIQAIAPGVMAQTGMETASIIKAIVKEMKPDIAIVIDSLAARSVKRLITSIQISDTGITPGSGVRNHRRGLCYDTLGIDVIALGIPTVIELIDTSVKELFVTPKDIDENIDTLSEIISRALNKIWTKQE